MDRRAKALADDKTDGAFECRLAGEVVPPLLLWLPGHHLPVHRIGMDAEPIS